MQSQVTPPSQPWWMTDSYTEDVAVPSELVRFSGPQGVAVVRAWKDGKTDKGWGEFTFMNSYEQGRFKPGPRLPGFEQGRWALAYVMRSMRLVCIDIDGKNGGFDGARKLGMLPKTLAESRQGIRTVRRPDRSRTGRGPESHRLRVPPPAAAMEWASCDATTVVPQPEVTRTESVVHSRGR